MGETKKKKKSGEEVREERKNERRKNKRSKGGRDKLKCCKVLCGVYVK